MEDVPEAGLYEALLTGRLEQVLARLPSDRLVEQLTTLQDGESADRMSRHVAHLLARAIEAAPERERAAEGVRLATALLGRLHRSPFTTCISIRRSPPIRDGSCMPCFACAPTGRPTPSTGR